MSGITWIVLAIFGGGFLLFMVLFCMAIYGSAKIGLRIADEIKENDIKKKEKYKQSEK